MLGIDFKDLLSLNVILASGENLDFCFLNLYKMSFNFDECSFLALLKIISFAINVY